MAGIFTKLDEINKKTTDSPTSPNKVRRRGSKAAKAPKTAEKAKDDAIIVLPPVRTPVRRTITRYAFEFFQDQIEKLRKISLEEKIRGDKGSMSEMVREALDDYLAKKSRERTPVR